MNSRANTQFYLILFGIFTIYIHLLPIEAETFPALMLLFTTYAGILFFLKSENYLLYYDEAGALVLLIIIFCYGTVSLITDGSRIIIEVIKYSLGPLFYLYLRRRRKVICYKPLRNILLIVLFLTICVLLEIGPIISLFKMIIPRFVAIIKFRGISIFTTEPSYFSFFAMFGLVTTRYLYIKDRCSRFQYRFLLILIFILSIFTLSVYVFLTIFLFFIGILYYRNKMFGLLPFIVMLIVILFSESLPYSRITQMLVSTKKLIQGNITLNSYIFSYETSGTTRILLNLLAIVTIFIRPLGTGLSSFSSNILPNSESLGIDVMSHPIINRQLSKGHMYAQTYFTNLVNDIGLFSLLFLYIVFSNNTKQKSSVYYIALLYILFMTFFQGQITNPILWYLIVLLKKEDLIEK